MKLAFISTAIAVSLSAVAAAYILPSFEGHEHGQSYRYASMK